MNVKPCNRRPVRAGGEEKEMRELVRMTKSGSLRKRTAAFLSLFILLTVFMTMVAVPQEVHATSKKTKYSVKVNNINSNTVLKKGTKLKINCKGTKKKNGVTKKAKLKFKSSNKKVATVSQKGIIKAKKKGTAYITVYCSAKKSAKKKIKIRVGTKVSSISVTGFDGLRKGHSATLKAKTNSSATNKSVSWKSSDTTVATVSSSGKVSAKGYGTALITATAKDGSGVHGSRTIYVSKYSRDDARWIAHRGLHTSAKENTAAAFTAAGKAGFWGCECDIWETKKENPNLTLPALPSDPDNKDVGNPEEADGNDGSGDSAGQDEEEEMPDVINLQAAIEDLPAESVSYAEAHLNEMDIEAAWDEYEALTDGMTDAQKGLVRKVLLENTGADLLSKLFTLYTKVCGYDSMDLVINHDSTFSNGSTVKKLTKTEIKSKVSYACFFDEYLDICSQYNMTPIIEFKDSNMSEEAVLKAIEKIDSHGLLEEAYLISFYENVLTEANTQAAIKLDGRNPITYYLFKSSWSSKVNTAHSRGYTGVSVRKDLLTDSLYSKAKGYGMGVGTWTYKDTAADDDLMFKAVLSGKYALDFVTVDYRIF